MRNEAVNKISQKTIYSYATCEFIYEFMGVLGLDQEEATRKLLQKASGLGQDPIRLMFSMVSAAYNFLKSKGDME